MKLFSPFVVTATWSVFLESGTLSATAECYDDQHYRYNGYDWKDCEWVHENDYCDSYDNGHLIGTYYCPDSCHTCDKHWDDDHWDDDDWHEDDHWDDDDHHDDDHDDDHHDDDYDDDHHDDDEHHDDDDWYYHDCHDDDRYRFDGDKGKNCGWVADNHKCEAKRDGKHVGKYYCPESCDYCSGCSDDKNFEYDGYHWKDCQWIYDNDCCDHEQDGKHIGKHYCPSTCDYCGDWHEPSPTKKPTRKPTSPSKKPTRKPTKRPTKRPTRKPSTPTRQPSSPTRRPTTPTRRPTSKPSCNSVEIARQCYDIDDYSPEKVTVYFENCNSAPKDWIGIYEVQHGSLGQTLEWWGNSFMWKFACGSRSCTYAEDYGTVNFRNWWNKLSDGGEYKAYLFQDDGYRVKASSDRFEVGHCNGDHQPTRRPTSPTRSPSRPTSPTRSPTSWNCRSSVEVEQYCYKNRHPSRIEVTFENCHPTTKDWIGIYEVKHGSLGETLAWWGDSYMWKFLCGSDSCNFKEEYGTLFFDDWWMDLDNGQYRAYLFENDGYHVKAFSETFKVGDCYY